MVYNWLDFVFVPMGSHNFLYLLALISYIWIDFISITTRISWIITLIIFLAIIIKVLWFESVVIFGANIWIINLTFLLRPFLKIACRTLRSFWCHSWGPAALDLIISFWFIFVCNGVITLFRRLMCKNETLFLFRRHCLIHYNHNKINNFIILNYCWYI